MVNDSPPRVALLELDPDLAGGEDVSEGCAERLTVPVYPVPAGPVEGMSRLAHDAALGVLVVEGIFAREVVADGCAGVELFGAGNLITAIGADSLIGVPHSVSWSALGDGAVAVLDTEARAIAVTLPGMTAELLRRSGERADAEALLFAVSHRTRVEDRVIGALRLLAGRWGHVHADGVHLQIPLTHELLARLVGSRRPSVTSAIQRLVESGRVARAERGYYVLHEVDVGAGDPTQRARAA